MPAKKGRKNTAKPKAKSKVEKVEKGDKGVVKKQPKAKAKAKNGAKSEKRGKQTKKTQGSGENDDDGLVAQLTDFALSFDILEKATGDKFKAELRAQLPQFDHIALNIYWTRSSCGVRSPSEGKNIAHFSFSSSPCEDIYKTAVAVKCGEMLATRILTFRKHFLKFS